MKLMIGKRGGMRLVNKLFQEILEPYRPLSGSKEIRQSRGTSEGVPQNAGPTCYDFKNRHEETAPAQNTFPVPALAEPIPCNCPTPAYECGNPEQHEAAYGKTPGYDFRRRGNSLSGGVESRHADSGSSTSAHNITGPKDDVASEGSVSPAQNTYANCPYKHVPERGNVYCTIKDCGVNKGWGTCLWENTLSGGEGRKTDSSKATSFDTTTEAGTVFVHETPPSQCTCLKITRPGRYKKLDADCPIHAPPKWPSIAEQEAYWKEDPFV
jgi:hypothetical protein